MLLNEQEIDDLSREMVKGCKSVNWLAQKIESAVLEKLKAQEPVAIVGDVYQLLWFGSSPIAQITSKHGIKVGDNIYTHPLPPDDVVQKYEELLYAVHRKFPDETRHQTALRYIKTAESPSYTNASVKEK